MPICSPPSTPAFLRHVKAADGSYQQLLDTYLASPEKGDAQLSFWGLLVESLPALLKGLAMTLAATALSLVFASILGVVFGFMKVSGKKILRL